MDDLISRKAAIEAMTADNLSWNMDSVFDDDLKRAARAAQRALARLPAADVREVKRGRWVRARGSWYTPGGDPVWECSECGKGRHVYGVEHGSYGADVADGQWVSCPNCSADMREEP